MNKVEIKRREVEAVEVYRVIENIFYLERGTWIYNHRRGVKLWPKYRVATSYNYPWLWVYSLKSVEKGFLIFKTQKELADKMLLKIGNFNEHGCTIDCYHPGIWSEALLENADELNALANKKHEEERKAEEERIHKEKEIALASIDY